MSISALYHATKSSRVIRRMRRLAERANAHEADCSRQSTAALQERAWQIAPSARASEARLCELFAIVREVSRRTMNLRQHDVQLMGGLVLFEGKLAEMRTGEGKTLTIAAPCIAAALAGEPVHVVTVNEYLASRDAETLRPLYEAFGLSVGVLLSGQTVAEKKAAYGCSVVYGVNHEFGFDYLRDNMCLDAELKVQRGLGFVVVDEVDSILIDEARTPLIISGRAPAAQPLEGRVDKIVRELVRGQHFTVDEKLRNAVFTDDGYSELERRFVEASLVASLKDIYGPEGMHVLSLAAQALLAHQLYRRDKHYVVIAGEAVIVDPSTGRLMQGRRWGDGLHEAVEAKEGLDVKAGTMTQATITYQNFFGLYSRLAGLTGTAVTEAEEFVEIYGLPVVVVPPNRPSRRDDMPDVVFGTREAKFQAVVADVMRRNAKGQPVLVGTASVTDSEHVSALLTAAGVAHQVLNARQNAQEAEVISRAGLLGAVTVATNMAGRGTDIVLGGSVGEVPEDKLLWESRKAAVLAAGGLHVLGTERHESRRIDNQLRGRAGRQGDFGSSQFYLSLEDRLLRVFAPEGLGVLRNLLGSTDALSHPLVDKTVTTAQRRMEERGFEARRELMKYDGVLSSQRAALYAMRDELLDASLADLVRQTVQLGVDAGTALLDEWVPSGAWLDESFDALALKNALMQSFGVSAPVVGWVHHDDLDASDIRKRVVHLVSEKLREHAGKHEAPTLRAMLLEPLDARWVEHLTAQEGLRQSIGLRSMAQQNPVHVYASESRRLFVALRANWAMGVVDQVVSSARFEAAAQGVQAAEAALNPAQKVQLVQLQRFVTRNEPCPCGSGKRFKACHGAP